MRKIRFISLFLVLMIFCSCQGLFIEPDSDNTPEKNFEILWQEFDRYYSYFVYKDIDWYSLYNQYRPQVSAQTSDQELFTILSSMLDILKDGHVNLYTPHGIYSYDAWWSDYPANFDLDIIRRNYLTSGYTTAGRGTFTYGKLTDEIGYIHISSFVGSEETFLEISGILEKFRDLKGLVVDIRHNGGGSTNNSDLIAARFADQKRLYAYVKWRNGPEHDDFTEPQELIIEPSEEWRFSKPVALLTNRSVFSSAEDFVLAMRVFPHVTVIGDITGGGAGNPILRELPNGWVYRLSRWQELTPEMEMYEGIGLMPDVLVGILEEDLAAGRDTILETAITTLEFFFD